MFDELTMEQKIKYILTGLEGLNVAAEQLRTEISHLEKAGYCNATEWWKDGKYLYLIYPTDAHGNRKREYIGACSRAVNEARARINRYALLTDARARLRVIENKQHDTRYHFDRAIMALGGQQIIMEAVRCE